MLDFFRRLLGIKKKSAPATANTQKKFAALNEIAPLKKGEKVGETMYYLNGKRIGSVDIITTEEIEKQNYRSALENVLEEYVL